MDYNIDIPYVQDCIHEKYIQPTEQLAWSTHEKKEEQNMRNQKHKDDHNEVEWKRDSHPG